MNVLKSRFMCEDLGPHTKGFTKLFITGSRQ